MTPPTKMTAEEFYQWVDRPENADTQWELVRGQPAPLWAWPDGFDAVHLHVVDLLSRYVFRRGAGSVAFQGDGLITARDPDTVRCPDAMLFLGPPPGDDFPPRYTTEVPQLVVELSPTDTSYGSHMRRMIDDIVGAGVPVVWVLEPDEPGLIVCQPKRPPYVLEPDDELSGFPSLPDFSCRVRDLFPAAAPAQQS